MPERLMPGEAWREGQFIQKAAQEKANKRGAEQADGGDYESMSSTLDAAQRDDHPRYERLLRLGELANEVEPVNPMRREAFVRIVQDAIEPVLDTLKTRADEIKLYVVRLKLQEREADVARKEKITQVVDEYLSQVLRHVDRAVREAPEFNQQSRGDADDLDKLKRYHLGPETQAMWRNYVATVLERLTDSRRIN